MPEFLDPPLNEVVLGVQFSRPKGYQQVRAGEVWGLYRNQYPEVQELPALPPVFEVFGLPHSWPINPSINIISGATHDRFWFLQPDGAELIQFQEDRLLHNWRKVGEATNAYPRFESMIRRFKEELEQLQTYMSGLDPQSLSINQSEISYINHIGADQGQELRASEWIRFLSLGDSDPDDLNLALRDVIRGEDQKPEGRLICDIATGRKTGGQRIIQLTLTVRGVPKGTNISAALDFITRGRTLIVNRFTDITTESAHLAWKRQQ
ncbi:MAG: TIGR04255 family protein [Gammaproteobacteria bacterium]